MIDLSNPDSKSQRVNMTLKSSTDNGKTWHKEVTVHAGEAMYSVLVPLSKRSLGVMYERDFTGLDHPTLVVTLAIVVV